MVAREEMTWLICLFCLIVRNALLIELDKDNINEEEGAGAKGERVIFIWQRRQACWTGSFVAWPFYSRGMPSNWVDSCPHG